MLHVSSGAVWQPCELLYTGYLPDQLGQTNYAEILVTKYISKPNKIRTTCRVVSYVFQRLVIQLLDNSANKHAEQPRFFHALTAAHAL